MSNSKNSKPNVISIGSASILMVFVILCLTVFSVLAYVTANSEKNLSQSESLTVKEYYDADYRACDIYNQICENRVSKDGIEKAVELADEYNVKSNSDGYIVDYSINVDEKCKLSICLEISDNDTSIKKWQIENITSDTIEIDDNSSEFWDGSFPILE